MPCHPTPRAAAPVFALARRPRTLARYAPLAHYSALLGSLASVVVRVTWTRLVVVDLVVWTLVSVLGREPAPGSRGTVGAAGGAALAEVVECDVAAETGAGGAGFAAADEVAAAATDDTKGFAEEVAAAATDDTKGFAEEVAAAAGAAALVLAATATRLAMPVPVDLGATGLDCATLRAPEYNDGCMSGERLKSAKLLHAAVQSSS